MLPTQSVGRISPDESLPILSSFTYLESDTCFGCGAGLTHVYIDGSGEVCPCNLVPLSFGRVTERPLQESLAAMRRHFATPRGSCAGKLLAPFVPAAGPLPEPPEPMDMLEGPPPQEPDMNAAKKALLVLAVWTLVLPTPAASRADSDVDDPTRLFGGSQVGARDV